MDLSEGSAQSSAMSWFARLRLPVCVCACMCKSVLGGHNGHLVISLLTVGPGERPGKRRQRSLGPHRKWFLSAEIKLCHRASQRGSSLHSQCAQVRPLGGGVGGGAPVARGCPVLASPTSTLSTHSVPF